MQDGNDNDSNWVFKPDDVTDQPTETQSPLGQSEPLTQQVEADLTSPSTNDSLTTASGYPLIEWSASEYVAHQRTYGWYILLGVASLGVAAVVYLVTSGDIISTVVIILLGLSLGIFATRQPRELNYAIDNAGVQVGDKFYPYNSFKTYSIVRDQGLGYISLTSLRRFMPPLIIHYDPTDEDQISQALSQYLPYDEHKPDIADIISRKIRF